MMLWGEGELLIRVLTPDDISADYLETLNSAVATRFLSQTIQQPHTRASTSAYIQEKLESSSDLLFGLFRDNILLGTSRLHEIGIFEQGAWQGILILIPYQGLGFGTKLVRGVSDFALQSLKLSKVCAGIDEHNLASQRCFQRAGFSYWTYDQSCSGRQIWIKDSC